MDEVGTAAMTHAPPLTPPPPEAGASAAHLLPAPALAGPVDGWELHLDRAAALGFSHVLTAPPFLADDLFLAGGFRPAASRRWGGRAMPRAGSRRIAALCRERGMELLLDVVTDRVSTRSAWRPSRFDLFAPADPDAALDPRRDAGAGGAARGSRPGARVSRSGGPSGWRAGRPRGWPGSGCWRCRACRR